MLVNHLHPNRARRIDGAGGDDGRDVQVELDDGNHFFEIKRFALRLTPKQKRQIKNSLLRAAELDPIDWTLLMPLDQSPDEVKWFDGLRELVNFPIEWHGKTWIETELAQRPFIQRYYLDGELEELRRLAELFSAEQAALTRGAIDAVERIQNIANQLNDLDPFFRVEITVGEESRITVIPRYKGAEIDRGPLTSNFEFAFPATEEGRAAAKQFEDSIDFGTAASIPADYIKKADVDLPFQIGKGMKPERIDMGNTGSDKEQELLVAAVGPDGATLAELPLMARLLNAGKKGGDLDAHDATGWLTARMRVVLGDKGPVTMSVKAGGGYYPTDMLRLVKFLGHLKAGNFFVLRWPNGNEFARTAVDQDYDFLEPGFPEFIEDMALIQWATGMSRRIGGKIDGRDLAVAEGAARALRGDEMTSTWEDVTINVLETLTREELDKLRQDSFDLRMDLPSSPTATIAGVTYRLGNRVEQHLESATLAPEHADLRENGVPSGAKVRLVPAANNRRRWRILR